MRRQPDAMVIDDPMISTGRRPGQLGKARCDPRMSWRWTFLRKSLLDRMPTVFLFWSSTGKAWERSNGDVLNLGQRFILAERQKCQDHAHRDGCAGQQAVVAESWGDEQAHFVPLRPRMAGST